MRPVQRGPLIGLVAAAAVLLGALAATVGLGAAGWAGRRSRYGVGARRCCSPRPGPAGRGGSGPADRVTLARASLVVRRRGAGRGLVRRGRRRSRCWSRSPRSRWRSTRSTAGSPGAPARRRALGARFDMEVDAFLILVLSVYVARRVGWWVLAIGLARYALVARPVAAALAAPAGRRRGYWGKVVAAVQGVVLTVVGGRTCSRTPVAVAAARRSPLVLLAESFGHEVWWLWRHRAVGAAQPAPERAGVPRDRRRPARRAAPALTGPRRPAGVGRADRAGPARRT